VNLNYNIENNLDIRKEVNNIFIREGDHFEETNFNEFHTHYHFHSREPEPSTRNEGVSDEEMDEIVSNLKPYENGDVELPENLSENESLFNGGSRSDPPPSEGKKPEENPKKKMRFRILKFLDENPASTLAEIADGLDEKQNLISPYLLRFAKNGLVEREKFGEYHYWISERGRKFLEIHG